MVVSAPTPLPNNDSEFEILRFSDTQHSIIRKRKSEAGVTLPGGFYEFYMRDVGGRSNAKFVLNALREEEKRRRERIAQGAATPIISEVSDE